MKYNAASGEFQYGDEDGLNHALFFFTMAGFSHAWRGLVKRDQFPRQFKFLRATTARKYSIMIV